MPEFTVKEVRLPELHLPEIKRDEIVRALSGIHVPEVDLAKVEPGRRLRDANLRTLRGRGQKLSGSDVGKLVAAAIATARIVRPAKSRSRWSPFRTSRWAAVNRSRDNLIAVVRPAPRRSRRRLTVVVIAVTAAAAWMLFRNPAVRSRLDRAVSDARRRIDRMRARGNPGAEVDAGEPVSMTATEGVPSEAIEVDLAEAGTEIVEPAANPA